MTEAALISIFNTKENVRKYFSLVKSYAICKETSDIVNFLKDYFNSTGSDELDKDWSDFIEWFKLTKTRTWSDADRDMYLTIIKKAAVLSEKGSSTADAILKEFSNLVLAARLSSASEQVIDGTKKLEPSDFKKILEDHEAEYKIALSSDDTNEYFVDDDIDKLAKTVSSTGYNWLLDDMNVSVGPIRKGDLIIVGARPETGKTSFVISEACHMIKGKGKVLFVNNEEGGEKILLRSYCSVLNKSDTDVLADTKLSKIQYKNNLKGGEFIIWDKAHCTVSEIEALCEEVQPDIIVFNVLDKVRSSTDGKDANEAQRLRSLFQWARELAKTYGPVFVVAQADGSAHGQKWIQDVQLYGSKTGIQGEADVIIGIGKTLDPSEEDTRFIHVAKNKNISGPRTISGKKHGMFEVNFDDKTGRYKSKVKY